MRHTTTAKRPQPCFSADGYSVHFDRPSPEELGIECDSYDRDLYIKQIDNEYTGREQRYAAIMQGYSKAEMKGAEARTDYGTLLIGKKVGEFAACIERHAKAPRYGRPSEWMSLFDHGLDYAVIANVALTITVEGISDAQPLGALSMRIARALEDEINFTRLRLYNAESAAMAAYSISKKGRYSGKHEALRWYVDDTQALRWFTWDDNVRMSIGYSLLVLMNKELEWFNVDTNVTYVNGKARRETVIMPSQSLMYWIDEARKHVALHFRPSFEPMIVPPRKWTPKTLQNGAYLTPANKPLAMVKTHNRAYLRELRNADMPDVYEALNLIQETPFAINTRVTKLCRQLSEWQYRKSADLKLPVMHKRKVEEEVRRPAEVDTDAEALYWYQKSCEDFHKDEAVQRGKRISFYALLDMAERYSEFDEIYCPWQGDTRFRVYPVPKLNCQGSDSTKAYLHYADPMPLGEHGLKWLEIGISGLFGVDKCEIEERLQWVKDNRENIKTLATNPTAVHDFWKSADKPMQAYAFACELNEAWAMADPRKYLSRLSVPLDGSCSGLQVLAMALCCEQTGKHVNLVPGNKKPADIYGVIAGIVKKELEEIVGGRSYQQLVKDAEKATHAQWRKLHPEAETAVWLQTLLDLKALRAVDGTDAYLSELSQLRAIYYRGIEAYAWLQFGLDRKTVKRNVMTYCYGAEQFGFADQIREDILTPAYKKHRRAIAQGQESHWPFHGTGRRAAQLLAAHVFPAVKRTVIRAAQAMDWLQAVAALITKYGRPVMWTTPMNFPVLQDYRVQAKARIKCQLLGIRHDLTISRNTDKLDTRKAATAVSPNCVHSLDSAHLQRVVITAFRRYGIKHFSLVHDSFATHAGKTEELFLCIREAMIEMFTERDVFAELHKEFEQQVPPEHRHLIPPLPEYGTLDREGLKESTFAFI